MIPSDVSSPVFARATRPDAEDGRSIVLIKNASFLRATYQVRLLAYRAHESGKHLVLVVPEKCVFSPGLLRLVAQIPGAICRKILPAA